MNTFFPDDDTIRDYIQRKLGPEAEERVELWLAEHPEVVADLEFDLALQEAMRDQPAQKTHDAERARIPDWLGWLMRPTFAGAAAAALAAAILTPTALYLAADTRADRLAERVARFEQARTGIRDGILVDLPITRGGPASDVILALPEHPVNVVFRAFVPDPTYPSYEVHLATESATIAPLTGLRTGADDSLVVSLDSARLSGIVRLSLLGRRDSSTIEELAQYLIEIR